jgi:hypothetical protein
MCSRNSYAVQPGRSWWSTPGTLAVAIERALVAECAGDNALTREAVHAKLAALRAELAGSEASPLEKLLVERVVLCWLQVHHTDACFVNGKEATIPQADRCQRQQGRVQARYLVALKALVTVRRLLRPRCRHWNGPHGR